MPFNYEQSIWGRGVAKLNWSVPSSFRLRRALLALKNLPPQAKVIEVGCGAGQFIRALKQLHSDFDCYGCDISEQAIAQARAQNDGVSYELSEETSLPYAHDFFDAVLVFDVLEHVANPTLFLSQIERILKSGGVVYMYVPCENDPLSVWFYLRKFGLAQDWTRKFAGHINYFSRRSLKQLLQQFRFDILQIRYSEHFFGQLLSVLAFYLLARAAKKTGEKQINNEEFFLARHSSPVLKFFKKIINSVIYLESLVFGVVPSPNVNIVLKKFL